METKKKPKHTNEKKQNKNRLIDTENKLVVVRGKRSRRLGE